ncbi:MAG TPA: hypothetical protein VFC07_02390 [Verrucomicrobiae bacterium]|nr:hypothetical protein [Verrucomicrobiae bacterium]
MKYKKSIALITCLVSTPILTGCPSKSNNNNNNNNPPPNGSAPSSLSGHTISVSVNSGSAPFSSTGSYVFTPAGDGNSGSYQLEGTGGVQSNIGTYTYSANGNTGNLVETEQSGTLVNNTLTFTSSTSGTINSSSPSSGPGGVGGNESGTFTLN